MMMTSYYIVEEFSVRIQVTIGLFLKREEEIWSIKQG